MNNSPVSKAIAGAIVTAVVGYVARYGLTLDPVVVDAVSVLVTAVISAIVGYLGVYVAPRNADR